MKISELPTAELAARLKQGNLLLHLSPFVARIRTPIPAAVHGLAQMYGEFSVKDSSEFADFHVHLAPSSGLRRWVKRQASFSLDGVLPFKPLPLGQAYPMLEWGLNWCISSTSHQFLIIHAAAIEKNGRAVIFPAPPGSGKSTLCAGLVSRGWRLLSDELTLLDIQTGLIQPLSRPINLKNRSIEVIRDFWPEAVITQPVHDTNKGTVALVRPPAASVGRLSEPAMPAWIVLPKYQAASVASLTPYSKARTFMLIAEQTFNYNIHGKRGFELLGNLIDQCDCYEFVYSDLKDADRIFCDLAQAPLTQLKQKLQGLVA